MLLQFGSIANANVFNYGNVTITLPDSVLIMGSESGTEIRICTIKGSVDAAPGTTIPLRASFQAILIDSLLTRLNSAYVEATVEGLTHLDLIFRNNCSAQPGAVKPPYRWGGIVSRIPTDKPGFDAPANVNFVSSTYLPTPTPTPTPTPAPTPAPTLAPTPTLSSTIDEFSLVFADYQKLLSKISVLKNSYVNNKDLLNLEKKLLRLPIISGKDLSTAIYNIESVNKKIDSSIAVWNKIYITKIKCIKGNKTKNVTAKNPKCPTGYKKA